MGTGTMSDTTLTFTGKQGGKYTIEFKKSKYQDYKTTYIVNRYSNVDLFPQVQPTNKREATTDVGRATR